MSSLSARIPSSSIPQAPEIYLKSARTTISYCQAMDVQKIQLMLSEISNLQVSSSWWCYIFSIIKVLQNENKWN